MIKKVNVWTAVLITLLVCIVASAVGMTYLLNRYEVKQIDLANQIAELQKTSTSGATDETSATTDETADWKTYTNDTYGFSFKYPTSWAEKDIKSVNIDIPGLLTLPAVAAITGDPSWQDPFSVVAVSSQPKDKEITYRKQWATSGTSTNVFDSSTEITLYGKVATKLTFKNKTTNITSATFYVIADSGYTYFFEYGPFGLSNTINAQLNQILTTFHFTK
jgi:hypothetical protein